MDIDAVTHVVWGGGGVRGFCYFGALSALQDVRGLAGYTKWCEGLRFVAGTSIGALFALLLILELPPSSIKTLLRDDGTISLHLLPRPSPQSLSMLAMDDGTSLVKMVANMLAERNFSDNITLSGLRRCTKKLLRCTVCNVLTMGTEYLDADTAPEMRVVDAVAASMRIPLVYAQHVDHERRVILTDGGGVDNFPLGCLPKDLPVECLLGMRTSHSDEPLDFEHALTNGRLCTARALMGPLAALDAALFDREPKSVRDRVLTFDTGGVTGIELHSPPHVCSSLWMAGATGMYMAISPARGDLMRVIMTLVRASVEARQAVIRNRALSSALRRYVRVN
jgi:predicted acylesterase/phospholipase RssA